MEITFKAFLSHHYDSPEVNLFFFDIFRGLANVQFEVDQKKDETTKERFETNVTRLERKIRDADAFIGIYPFPAKTPGDHDPTPARLREESKYFRLELDMAFRARKPAIVFVDDRYGRALRCPPGIRAVPFNAEEVTGSALSPRRDEYARHVALYCEAVQAWRGYTAALSVTVPHPSDVRVLLPSEAAGYAPEHVELIHRTLEEYGVAAEAAERGPFRLDAALLGELATTDWAVVDIGDECAALAAYLHGAFVPTLRLRRVASAADADAAPSPLETTLYGAHQAGYLKNVVRWHDAASLREGLDKRLTSLRKPRPTHVRTAAEAERYFRSAATRTEPIFLSYSGKDAEVARRVGDALRARFARVFDYRDGESITPGAQWIDVIFKTLAESAVAVPLLSANYVASGNCTHELREMVARGDSGRLRIVPVRLTRDADLSTLPAYIASTQYQRTWDPPGGAAGDDWWIGALIAAIESSIEQPAPPPTP